MRRARRGWAVLGALMTILALVTVATVGFRARDRDLAFEDGSVQRAQARWAAEAAVARGLARMRRGQPAPVKGELPSDVRCARVRYALTPGPQGSLRAEGRCEPARGRPVTAHVVLTVTRGPAGPEITSWREGPP